MSFKLSKSNLNFKVYTVEAKPTAPGAENDIAIISSVPMSNWIMSPEKPSGIPRNDGDVWIQYSVDGNTFNVLKQNTLMIATISAWQYVDGAWVDVEAMSYQGGEWKSLGVLPAGYRAVEYLESSGSQYINLGFDTKGGTVGIKIKLKLLKFSDLQFAYFYGSQKTASPIGYFASNVSNGTWGVEYGSGLALKPPITASEGAEYEIMHNYLNSKKYVVNGTEHYTDLADCPSSGYNIFLFGDNLNGSFTRGSRIRLYECEITDGTNVVRKFIPCVRRSDSVPGLYDTVTKTFYANSGSGSFAVGGTT